MKHIISFLACLFATTILLSCKPLEPVTISGIENARMKSINDKKVEIEVDVKVHNPNPYGFTIYKSSAELKLNNAEMGQTSLSKKVKIKANSDLVYTFSMSTELSKLLSGGLGMAVSLFQNGNATIGLKGNMKVGKFLIRKKIPFDIKEKVPFGK